MQPYRRLRWAYLLVGWLGTALGVTGALLPVLPATPSLLVAAWGFGRGSPDLHGWLLAHPRFGGTLRNWHEHGAIAPWIKAMALAGLVSSILAVFSATELLALRALHIIVITGAASFILTRPSPRNVATPVAAE